MGKIAYFDCPTGIAGDMCLGALVDAGLPWQELNQLLQVLGLAEECQLWSEEVLRQGQRATKVQVKVMTRDHHHHRHLPEIEQIIQGATLPPQVKEWSLQIFRQLAIAEGIVHGVAPEKVHFHEVGATDALVDIVGTCLGLHYLEIETLYCSALPTGGGTVKAAHGRMPVPVPAVLELWQMRQVPVYSNGIERELVTPTGAAIVTTLAEQFGPIPAMQLGRVGLGAGDHDLSMPNILRLWIGERQEKTEAETVAVLETQVDDLTPQAIAYTSEELLKAGALDVFTQAIGMKKSRPGHLITVICHPETVEDCQDILFRETTTLGIRSRLQTRRILARELCKVETPYGEVRVKIARQGTDVINIQPEYEDCAKIARERQKPLATIQQMVLQEFKVNGL
ncbi:nickel pincer cofactor biosynthesis protein LarC [Spirulina subsalsa FACHB-351]|uniref:Putative nickel insertion protein n=1 Tax=Spirulina subsalsa FACHB-351 TaxID=234711 RepID=A0ABT3L3L9_9CYAN|nr:nickel pincer cofactor biosynthesis protein LarC [Spirulina subsalsa]MCW6036060.1 nickel pincer cofactor biosynthesis protein LarC [Spirulina subsalsa FACHB-351]